MYVTASTTARLFIAFSFFHFYNCLCCCKCFPILSAMYILCLDNCTPAFCVLSVLFWTLLHCNCVVNVTSDEWSDWLIDWLIGWCFEHLMCRYVTVNSSSLLSLYHSNFKQVKFDTHVAFHKTVSNARQNSCRFVFTNTEFVSISAQQKLTK